jgi:DNA replication protein DnaC
MYGLRPLYIDNHFAPPRLQSYLYWKDIFEGKVPEYDWMPRLYRQNGYIFPGDHATFIKAQRAMHNNSECFYCGGLGTKDNDGMYYYCLCRLLRIREEIRHDAKGYITKDIEKKSLSDLEIVGQNKDQIASLKYMVDSMTAWMKYPTKHVVLSGPTGVGKTHVLNAIATQWYPWFILLVASDFERMLRDGLAKNMAKKSGDDSNIDNVKAMMDVWLTHPGLLFDDLGIEYASPWIVQKLEDLIEYRTRKTHWWDTITVFSTNLKRTEINQRFVRDGVSRIGSRLTDTEIVNWIGIDALDYRNRKR